MTKVEGYHGLTVESRGTRTKDRENLEEEIRPQGSHSMGGMGQGRSGTRVVVATCWDSRNGGHLPATDGLLDHDSDFCPGLDSILDLCDGPCPGGHGLDRRSSGLSAPDSYETQP